MQCLKPSPVRLGVSSRRTATTITAIYKKKAAAAKTVEKEAPAKGKKKEEGMMAQTLNALNFSAVPTSKKDSDLIYEAKYGERGADGKMSREQYAALRRKVVGTAKDYFKDWVEEEQVKLPTYYKPDDKIAAVPYLPVLISVLLAVLVATVVVVQQTGTH